MTAHAAEFFTLDEVNRLKIIQDVVDLRLTTLMAAQRLGISDRQCRRLLSRYRESGPLGMASRRRGKPSNNQLPDGLAQYALNIIRESYTNFGQTRRTARYSPILKPPGAIWKSIANHWHYIATKPASSESTIKMPPAAMVIPSLAVRCTS